MLIYVTCPGCDSDNIREQSLVLQTHRVYAWRREPDGLPAPYEYGDEEVVGETAQRHGDAPFYCADCESDWLLHELIVDGEIQPDPPAPAEVEGHIEALLAMRSLFGGDRIPSPCAERDAIDAAIAALQQAQQPGIEYVREGVCLLCGGAVLNSGEHLEPERHAAEVARITHAR